MFLKWDMREQRDRGIGWSDFLRKMLAVMLSRQNFCLLSHLASIVPTFHITVMFLVEVYGGHKWMQKQLKRKHVSFSKKQKANKTSCRRLLDKRPSTLSVARPALWQSASLCFYTQHPQASEFSTRSRQQQSTRVPGCQCAKMKLWSLLRKWLLDA